MDDGGGEDGVNKRRDAKPARGPNTTKPSDPNKQASRARHFSFKPKSILSLDYHIAPDVRSLLLRQSLYAIVSACGLYSYAYIFPLLPTIPFSTSSRHLQQQRIRGLPVLSNSPVFDEQHGQVSFAPSKRQNRLPLCHEDNKSSARGHLDHTLTHLACVPRTMLGGIDYPATLDVWSILLRELMRSPLSAYGVYSCVSQ